MDCGRYYHVRRNREISFGFLSSTISKYVYTKHKKKRKILYTYPTPPSFSDWLILDRSVCGDHDFNLVDRDFTLSDLKSSVTTAAEHHPYFNNAADSAPHQFFRILDNRTKSVLLSWPDHYPNEIINYCGSGGGGGVGAQIDLLLDDRPMSPNKTLSCFHCVQNPVRTIQNKRIDSLVIEYGSITFLLVHLEEMWEIFR